MLVKSFSLFTIPSPILSRAAHTVKVLSIFAISKSSASSERDFNKVIGRVPSIIQYLFLISPITRLTCIPTVAICLEVKISFEFNCFLSFVKLDMISSILQPAGISS